MRLLLTVFSSITRPGRVAEQIVGHDRFHVGDFDELGLDAVLGSLLHVPRLQLPAVGTPRSEELHVFIIALHVEMGQACVGVVCAPVFQTEQCRAAESREAASR